MDTQSLSTPKYGQKMRTFLEVENKMGPIIQVPANQYRLPLPEMNPNVRKGNATEKRRTVTPKRKFRLVVPKLQQHTHPYQKPHQNPPAMQQQHQCNNGKTRHSMPGAGNMSGNLFQDRNWLLPKDYLATEKKE